MQGRDQIGAVIQSNVWLMVQGSMDMLVVGFIIFSLNGIDWDIILGQQSCGHIVLSAERIGGAEDYFGATGFEGEGEVCCLGSNMEASGNPGSFK